GAVGSFNWGGLWGTYFWIDPVERLAAVQMLQVPPEANNGQSNRALRHLTYAALSVPQPATSARPASAAADRLASYAGKYDFGTSLSSRDRQGPLPGLSGVGLELAKAGDQVVVQKVIDGTPAARAGLSAGDVVTDIDDKPIKDLAIALVIERMRGTPG